jgi:hypothetical protein
MKLRRTGVVALLGAVGLLQTTIATGAEPPRLTKPQRVTVDDLDPARTYSGPTLAVDPENPSTVVAAVAEMRTRRCGLMVSTNGGQSWRRLDSSPSPDSFPFCFRPNRGQPVAHVAFGRNSTLYYAMLGWDAQEGNRGNLTVLLARSTDLGESWTSTIVRNARGRPDTDLEQNGPITGLAVDRRSGPQDIVYVGWNSHRPPPTGPPVGVKPLVAVSTDAGKTFAPASDLRGIAFDSEPIRAGIVAATTGKPVPPPTGPPTGGPPPAPPQLDNPDIYSGREPTIAVDDQGALYVAWALRNDRVTAGSALMLSKSTDKAKTFTTDFLSPFDLGMGGLAIMKWSPKGGSEGSLHVVYEATTRPDLAGERDINYRRSTDGGRTWTEPRILNDDDPAAVYGNYLPTISVAPGGRLDVAWWDRRNDPGLNAGFGNDVYHTSSNDNGTTWSANNRVTDRLVDRRIGVFGNNFDVWAPPGLAALREYVVLQWDDTRDATPTELGGGTQDLYMGMVQYETIGGGWSTAAKAVLAGTIGLVVVGLILLALAMAKRKHADVAERTVDDRVSTPVDVT